MGLLESEAEQAKFLLPSRSIVGRADGCDLRLDDSRVSGEHASIYHEDGNWLVRDLASRNGTTVNGVALEPRDRRVLPRGGRVCFGSADQTWILVDDAAPVDDGIDATEQSSLELDKLLLQFAVSLEEENVYLTIVHDTGEIRAPERAYLYLLLLLARARVADDQLPEAERGWVHTDELVPRQYPDLETLNVHIYRARKLFSQLGVRDAKRLVERRKGSGHVRLGVPRIELEHAPSKVPQV